MIIKYAYVFGQQFGSFVYGRRFFVPSFSSSFFFSLSSFRIKGGEIIMNERPINFFNTIQVKSSPISRYCVYTVIGFHLSTSDTTGSAIESSKPNPILIDVRERRGVTIARIIFGATNTTYFGRPPDLDQVLSYNILTRDGETEKPPRSSSSSIG